MIDAQPTVVSLSDAAATKLRELTKDEPNSEIGLRVYVYSGGCSGYRYGMMLEDAPTTDDNVLSANGVRVYIDIAGSMRNKAEYILDVCIWPGTPGSTKPVVELAGQ